MNRLIILGNGFDLAHGLKTSYTDFINNYWETVINTAFDDRGMPAEFSGHMFEDEFIAINLTVNPWEAIRQMESYRAHQEPGYDMYKTKYKDFRQKIAQLNKNAAHRGYRGEIYLTVDFHNNFFKDLNEKVTLRNWVDIEEEYYKALTEIATASTPSQKDAQIHRLNTEFEQIKQHLEAYLTQATQTADKKPIRAIRSITDAIGTPVTNIGTSAEKNPDIQQIKKKHSDKIIPASTLILNFNYTNTYKNTYPIKDTEIINIHGSLNDKDNPIIFGYGDEMNRSYTEIEDLGNNEFLTNIKSMNYAMTDNYDRLTQFIGSDYYQVQIMGHSCGNSDRLLLNRIFEHRHCTGIQIHYYEYERDGHRTNDYKDKVMNISRMFKDKNEMRGRIINYKACRPLIPLKEC